MELPRRTRGDELLRQGELAGIRQRLRQMAPKHDLTTGTTLAQHFTGLLPISNSDSSNILKAPGGGNITFTIGSVAGAANEKVTSFGFTVLTQSVLNGVVYTATATFDDGTTSVATKTLNRSTSSSIYDNFWGFTAPTSHYITAVALTTNAASSRDVTHIDDVGFVTAIVPEPSTAATLLASSCLLSLRRRRKA